MPVTVVVGGQFGSEGKGEVAYWWAQRSGTRVAVRVGGPNSGHTVTLATGRREVLRHLPTAALLPDTISVLTPGTYIDVPTFLEEVHRLGLGPSSVKVDPFANVVTDTAKQLERAGPLGRTIGSTQTGTGAAVTSRIRRDGEATLAKMVPELDPFLGDSTEVLREYLDAGARVLIEGTQGFGLSLLHSRDYPFVTSRDTSAAGMLSEAGLGPLDVDEVVMVLRAFPIRVCGASGPLPREIEWRTIRAEGGHDHDIIEYTSVTKRLRRVARFDPEVVRRAIQVNTPSTIVLNHVDYVDHAACGGRVTAKVTSFVEKVEESIGRPIDYIGLGPGALMSTRRESQGIRAATG